MWAAVFGATMAIAGSGIFASEAQAANTEHVQSQAVAGSRSLVLESHAATEQVEPQAIDPCTDYYQYQGMIQGPPLTALAKQLAKLKRGGSVKVTANVVNLPRLQAPYSSAAEGHPIVLKVDGDTCWAYTSTYIDPQPKTGSAANGAEFYTVVNEPARDKHIALENASIVGGYLVDTSGALVGWSMTKFTPSWCNFQSCVEPAGQ